MYRLVIASLAFCVFAFAAHAQKAAEGVLPLDGQIAADGSHVDLNWFATDMPRIGNVMVQRRLLGETGGYSWQTIAPGLGPVMRYEDASTAPGIAYEYQVLRRDRDIIDVGYWATGVALPAQEQRGFAHLVVDETIAPALAAHLDRFQADLIGDGWLVDRLVAPRGGTGAPLEELRRAVAIKQWLQARHAENPAARHAVILVGHLPIVKSGRVNPDGHDVVPHATDLFYGDVDGTWTAAPDGILTNSQLPSDFIEMQVGRIDFAPVSPGDDARERHLLRAYFDKNHHWRMGLLGDLREAYGNPAHLATEVSALANIVGPAAVTAGGHHDAGEQKPWLWGVDFGDWNGARYAADYANKAVFAINFGSGKQKIDNHFNGMTALLAQPWYPVAVGWGGRPAWRLHHMALGGSIGDVHMRTVNNGMANQPYRQSMDYFPTGRYMWRNPIWVNLLGDPTAHAFVLAPVRRLQAEATDQGIALAWAASADPDTRGYRVYRAVNGAGFEPLDGGVPMTGTRFTDPAPVDGAVYMVRATALKQVHAGSFHTLSQGVFASLSMSMAGATPIQVTGRRDQPVTLPAVFSAPAEGVIHALIAPPAMGDLDFDGQHWRYQPKPGFTGEISMDFSVWNGHATEVGVLTLRIVD